MGYENYTTENLEPTKQYSRLALYKEDTITDLYHSVFVCTDTQGRITFPGGMVEEGENVVDTLMRELNEEWGIEPIDAAMIYFLSRYKRCFVLDWVVDGIKYRETLFLLHLTDYLNCYRGTERKAPEPYNIIPDEEGLRSIDMICVYDLLLRPNLYPNFVAALSISGLIPVDQKNERFVQVAKNKVRFRQKSINCL